MRDATRQYRTLSLATLFALTLATVAPAANAQSAAPTSNTIGMDSPMAVAWPVRRAWSDAAEVEYGQFVSTIGHAVAAGRCHSLSACLNDPNINPLY